MEVDCENFGNLFAEIYDRHGYDFRNYAMASLERRVEAFSSLNGIESWSDLRKQLLENENSFSEFIMFLTVQVTEMFRDPFFYVRLREEVLPVLATYPRIKIWHAGCSSGEEVYSLAIMLHEADLLNRSLLYATDINQRALDSAHRGHFPLRHMKTNTRNYIESGGKSSFSEYFSVKEGEAHMAPFLRKRMVYSFHNLAVDAVFAEVQMVVCRNVFIYFNKDLQQQVLEKFDASLGRRCFLALGDKEHIGYGPTAKRYEEFASDERIYRKAN